MPMGQKAKEKTVCRCSSRAVDVHMTGPDCHRTGRHHSEPEIAPKIGVRLDICQAFNQA